ncbi:GNAT family N-acetyltransferase [Legionella micdadei]|uniref:Acetyltransferase, GNAT family n=1 Tax=Legionella micdadei TaxID=451 RepID=A0A098GC39_LEGMI|nr:GNAT family N-acetyltransferase [Legionella micdadei]ARG98279.1 GNAT family N-acetyltransferase [Legionella micdadei]ARH01032.1 GNAT family N-acetyltransferase [Legionella micdadei]KTD27212.1 N-acetyltransferase ats1 [Legionella micdadei]NSL19644.1 GNAT family N-acetyltransferase [Legionella micdadei]CEG60054.1 Acetyltransferase, GNAT family [Legionella micdadei]
MQKKIRFATIDDFDFIYDSMREDLEEQGVLHRFKYSKEEFRKAIFGEKPLAHFLILLIDNQPAGFANYSIDYRNFTANSLANLYLNDLFIKKPYRRMRGATLLMDKLKEIAKQENCGRIEGVVLVENTEALEFYKKFLKAKIISDKLHYMRLELAQEV